VRGNCALTLVAGRENVSDGMPILKTRFWTAGLALLLACLPLRPQNAPQAGPPPRSISFEFAGLNVPIAGVAGDADLVFVGEPLNGAVVVLSRFTGKQIGELPPPPNGFALPFITSRRARRRGILLFAVRARDLCLPGRNPFR
jgi:hypothetical protein